MEKNMLHRRKLFDIDFFVSGYVNPKLFQAKPGLLQEPKSTAKDAIRNVNECSREYAHRSHRHFLQKSRCLYSGERAPFLKCYKY